MNDPILIDLVISEPILLDLELAPEYYVGTAQAGPQGPEGPLASLTKRIFTAVSDTTAVIDCESYDEYYLTAMSGNTAISVSGTPVDGQTIYIGLKDNGKSRLLNWVGITGLGVTLPTKTNVRKQHIIEIKYISSEWKAISVNVESLSDNLISNWELNGDVTDSHGSNHGMNYGTTAVTEAYDFESIESNYIRIPNTDFDFEYTDAFSVSLWVKIESLSSGQFLVSKMDGVSWPNFTGWALAMEPNGSITFLIMAGSHTYSIYAQTTETIAIGSWAHIATTINGSGFLSGVKTYINKIPSVSWYFTKDAFLGSSKNYANMNLGSMNDSLNFYDGLMRQVYIWNKELTADEIAENYNLTKQWHEGENEFKDSNLFGYYWEKYSVTVVNDETEIAPDNTLSVSTVTETVNIGGSKACQKIISGFTGGRFAIYAKKGSSRYFTLRVVHAIYNWITVTFDVQTGVVTKAGVGASSTFTNVTYGIAVSGDGWYYCYLDFGHPDPNKFFDIDTSNTGNPFYGTEWGHNIYTGNTDNYLHFWNAFINGQ